MGTGTYATQCRKFFGDMNIEGVEIDDLILDEVAYYRDIYDKKGLKGLINQL